MVSQEHLLNILIECWQVKKYYWKFRIKYWDRWLNIVYIRKETTIIKKTLKFLHLLDFYTKKCYHIDRINIYMWWPNLVVTKQKETVMCQCKDEKISASCEIAKFESLAYSHTEYSWLQGSKTIRVFFLNPFGQMESTNNYRCIIRLVLRLKNGEKVDYNIFHQLKLITSRKKITQKYIEQVAEKMKLMPFKLGPAFQITNIKEIFAKCL